MKVFQQFHKKLHCKAGFSFAEMLMAILILLLASSIVATGVPVAKNAYDKVVVAANAEVLLSTTVAALRDELGTAKDIEVTGGTSITYYDADINAWSKIYLNSSETSQGLKDTIMIQRYVKHGAIDAWEGDPYPLVSKAAGDKHHGLYATYGGVTGPDSSGIITITGLVVKRGTDTLTKPDQTLKIRVIPGG